MGDKMKLHKIILMTSLISLMAISTAFAGGNKEAEATAGKVPDTVRLNIASEPDSLNPWLSAASDTSAIFGNVFEGLLSFDEGGNLNPQISKSYTVSDDGLVYTFYLRDDVYFHNGTHLTSSDVLYSYLSLDDSDGTTYKFPSIDKCEVIDDYTFQITLKSAQSSFLISAALTKILPEDYSDEATHPIGTGPYKFVSYTPSQELVFVRNDDYYDEDNYPSIKNVEVYIMSDSSSVVAALQSGQIDIADISSNNVDMFKNNYTVISGVRNLVSLLVFNNDVKPLDDVRVRKAITMAINKEDVIGGVFDGYAEPVYSNLSPVFKDTYNSDIEGMYSYDVEGAKKLLSEAGYPNGFDLEVTVPGNYWQHVDTSQIVQQNLAKVGIKLNIKTVEWGTWLDDVYYGRNYTSTIIGIDGKLDPYESLVRYTTGYHNNFMNYSNSKYDELINEAVNASSEDKIELYKEAQKVVAEDAGCAFICSPSNIVAMRSDLKGYKFYPVYTINFSSLYYEE